MDSEPSGLEVGLKIDFYTNRDMLESLPTNSLQIVRQASDSEETCSLSDLNVSGLLDESGDDFLGTTFSGPNDKEDRVSYPPRTLQCDSNADQGMQLGCSLLLDLSEYDVEEKEPGCSLLLDVAAVPDLEAERP
jgi:hypothetical protein